MATCKINTALILNELNAPGTFDFPMVIKGRAVTNTLFYFKKSCDHFSSLFPDNEDADFKREQILFYFTNCFKFSLVAYPVAYHRDTFAVDSLTQDEIFDMNNNVNKNTPTTTSDRVPCPRASIENKCLFVIKNWDWVGRGGYHHPHLGKACFVFAILDW
jgi:hypothetical protein